MRLVYLLQPKSPDQPDNALEPCPKIRRERVKLRLRRGGVDLQAGGAGYPAALFL